MDPIQQGTLPICSSNRPSLLITRIKTKVSEVGTNLATLRDMSGPVLVPFITFSVAVLLLDEAMSGLDHENETLVLEALLDLARQKDETGKRKYTLIVIAHKLVTASQVDKVLVMDGGKLVAQGKHMDLLHTSLVYRKLAGFELNNQLVG
jgi:ABC-type cobalamin transport system ATPase subunit